MYPAINDNVVDYLQLMVVWYDGDSDDGGRSSDIGIVADNKAP